MNGVARSSRANVASVPASEASSISDRRLPRDVDAPALGKSVGNARADGMSCSWRRQ